jgi:hypothetical protein
MSFFPIAKETGITLFGILGAIGLGALVFILLSTPAVPSKWDGAIAIRICRDGTPILRLADGSHYARCNGLTAWRVEDPERVCQ